MVTQATLGKAPSKATVVGFARVSKSGKSIGIRIVEDVKRGNYINIHLAKLTDLISKTPEERNSTDAYVTVSRFND